MAVSDQQCLVTCALVMISTGAAPVRQAVSISHRGSRFTPPIDAVAQNAANRPLFSPHMCFLFQLGHRQSCLSIGAERSRQKWA
jgi:hypothetical protein